MCSKRTPCLFGDKTAIVFKKNSAQALTKGPLLHMLSFRLYLLLPFLLFLCVSVAHSQTLNIKYRDIPVDVTNGHFKKYYLKPSSFVFDIYFDLRNNYLLVNLKGTYYHYCGIGEKSVEKWVSSTSLGRHYLDNIRSHFDCRNGFVPKYSDVREKD